MQSSSKAVTATAIMLAVQDGRLDLDTAISKYLPEFRVNSVFEEDAEQKMGRSHGRKSFAETTARSVPKRPVCGTAKLSVSQKTGD